MGETNDQIGAATCQAGNGNEASKQTFSFRRRGVTIGPKGVVGREPKVTALHHTWVFLL